MKIDFHYPRIFAILLTAIMIATSPADSAGASRRQRTTAVSRSKSKKAKSTKTKSRTGKKTRKSRTTSRRTGKTARRSYWRPFPTFESTAQPTPYYVPDDSIRSLRRKADNGNPEAQYLLGCSHFERRVKGANVDSADNFAAHYWALAAAQGHPAATGNYAFCLRTGRGVRPDTVKAVDFYIASILKGNPRLEKLIKQNADHGSPMDAHIMARCMELGYTNVEPGRDMSFYDQIAVSGGFTPSLILEANRLMAEGQNEQAINKLRSINNPDDDTVELILDILSRTATTDIDLLKNLAATGYPDAQLILADHLVQSGQPAEGYRWLYKAAQDGSDNALFKLVTLLSTEDSPLCDPYQAYLWLDSYVDGTDATAGEMAMKATGNQAFTDFVKALSLLDRKVTDQTDYPAALALLVGNPTRGAEALVLLCETKISGNSKASKTLKEGANSGEYLAPMAYSFINEKNSRKSLQKAADTGDVASANRLGIILCKNHKYEAARDILLKTYENAILSRDAMNALAECDEKISKSGS